MTWKEEDILKGSKNTLSTKQAVSLHEEDG